jgi:hypothetical protein
MKLKAERIRQVLVIVRYRDSGVVSENLKTNNYT